MPETVFGNNLFEVYFELVLCPLLGCSNAMIPNIKYFNSGMRMKNEKLSDAGF